MPTPRRSWNLWTPLLSLLAPWATGMQCAFEDWEGIQLLNVPISIGDCDGSWTHSLRGSPASLPATPLAPHRNAAAPGRAKRARERAEGARSLARQVRCGTLAHGQASSRRQGAVSAVMCSRASISRIFPLFNVIFPKRVQITHESAALALELRQGWS